MHGETLNRVTAFASAISHNYAARDEFVIAVVGGAFSAICLAAHLHRLPGARARVLVFERGIVGNGVAFGTREPTHLLNGPAGNLSAFDDIPDDFVDFLSEDPKAKEFLDPNAPIKGQFVPRMLYARYLERVIDRLSHPSSSGSTVSFVNAEVHNILSMPDHLDVVLNDGMTVRADAAVLAIGHPPPSSLATHIDPRFLIDDPWNATAIREIPSNIPVAIVGSGQTATDLVMEILSNGHRGCITLLSRRGRVALPYVPVKNAHAVERDRLPNRLLPLMRWVRSESLRVMDAGGDWRAVVNALRPHTQSIWHGFSLAEKRSFLEHLAPFWHIHRTRLPPQTAQRMAELLASGQVKVIAGRITGSESHETRTVLQIRPRGQNRTVEMSVGAVVNCTGPSWEIQKRQPHLITNLLSSGTIRWDDVGCGISVTPDGVPMDNSGRPAQRLFALGPVCRGSLLEIIGIRDIRTQCATTATRLLSAKRAGVGPEAMSRLRNAEEESAVGP
jgi:uncharacterized NAD(P)/FAD-binding protein YdhS